MKIALDWIADYLNPAPEAQAAAEALMNAGLPVESVSDAIGKEGKGTQVLDVEVTSNRTDCFSHVGLARELSALAGGYFSLPKIAIAESATPAAIITQVEVQDPAACPYYSARILTNVKVGPSPEWLRRRLESIGLRPINNVVDVTNYVLMELGQPLHAFDFDTLDGKRIVVRRAAEGEKMMAIDGHEYALQPHMLVIADGKEPAAIAGVMGGKVSEVTTSTRSILLESARFDPLSIRTTSRALGLKSDSSYRFERGIDPAMAETASRRAAQLILQIAGGELAQGAVAVGEAKGKQLSIVMRFKRFKQIVGIGIAPERAQAILNALGFVCGMDEGISESVEDDTLIVRVPAHRLDVEREIDIIEEVARVHGYEHVPTLDRVTHTVAPESVRGKAYRALRSAMVEAGFSEAVTVTFIAEAEAAAFTETATHIHPQHGGWKADVLRPSLLPSLLSARRTNQYAGIADAHLFETGATFRQSSAIDNKIAPPTETPSLAGVCGDVSSLTALLPLLADRLNPGAAFSVEPQDYPFFIRGTAGQVMLHSAAGKTAIGCAGIFLPELQKKYDLRHAAAGMELQLEPLLAIFQPVRRAAPVPRFPGVTRDLSVVMAESVRWAEVKKAIEGAKLERLERIEFVTTFRNAAIGVGKKSLTLTLNFRDSARTLTSEEVDAQVKTAVELLGKEFQAALRV
ncbi:MAG TPA: phenylalanine--tRNA ligase subunit beta [Phycisphaerae bacterium]|jgi:phenylalanyl-tRNA synthetase beta chain